MFAPSQQNCRVGPSVSHGQDDMTTEGAGGQSLKMKRVSRAGLNPGQEREEKELNEPKGDQDRAALSLLGWERSEGRGGEGRALSQGRGKCKCALHIPDDDGDLPHLSLDQDLPMSPSHLCP